MVNPENRPENHGWDLAVTGSKKDERRQATLGSVNRTVKVMSAVLFVIFILSLVMAIQLQERNDQLDSLEASSQRIERSTRDIEAFVDETIASQGVGGRVDTGELREVFRMVEEIRSIVCELSPSPESCR